MNARARSLPNLTPAGGIEERPEHSATVPERWADASDSGHHQLIRPHMPRFRVQPTIVAGNRAYRLLGTFVVEVQSLDDGDSWAVSHRTLPMTGYGASPEDAVAAFDEVFDSYWRRLIEAKDARLTPFAESVRAALQALVEGIEEVDPVR